MAIRSALRIVLETPRWQSLVDTADRPRAGSRPGAAGVGASIPRLTAKTPSDVRGEDVVNDQHYLTGFQQPA